eukprot:CAMPEP_0202711662 /NCGR_PEP_ID=MMETSP1385-20130828/23935_1 /ASSEMBLY_ACC=CAM_ASM_000861 /TAXON_ID=933848 /ORGANISM="Elphidium margaritaceum" /LENGTH=33 /DNA_ID= /DNA_START= /DNA_END= /DNA_ORIENTATION=
MQHIATENTITTLNSVELRTYVVSTASMHAYTT